MTGVDHQPQTGITHRPPSLTVTHCWPCSEGRCVRPLVFSTNQLVFRGRREGWQVEGAALLMHWRRLEVLPMQEVMGCPCRCVWAQATAAEPHSKPEGRGEGDHLSHVTCSAVAGSVTR